MTETTELLGRLGLPGGDAHALPDAPTRFPDGAHYRVEIPSVEGPRCLEIVLSEAKRYEVPVTRVSQGTGFGLLTDAELTEMVAMAGEAGVELSLFARPCAGWDASAMAQAPAGGGLAAVARLRGHGEDRLVRVAVRAADHLCDRFARMPGVDGHPEVEMALVKLYRATGQRRYLAQARRFVDRRRRRAGAVTPSQRRRGHFSTLADIELGLTGSGWRCR